MLPITLGILAGGACLALQRLLFAAPGLRRRLDPLSIGFLFVAPLSSGAVAVLAAGASSALAPLLAGLAVVLGAALLLATGLHRVLSVVMALPAFLASAVVGGLVAAVLPPSWAPVAAAVAMLLPPLVAAGEGCFPARTVYRRVCAETLIRARPETIWNQVVRVAAIRPGEWAGYRLLALLGFPSPREARLAHDGFGALRQGVFSDRVLFDEPVVIWRPWEHVRFAVHARPDALADLPFDDCTRLGGRYIDVIQAEYLLEPAGGGWVRVRLHSLHRLSTRVNAYAALWSDAILRAFQRSLLGLVKRRCERRAKPSGPHKRLNRSPARA